MEQILRPYITEAIEADPELQHDPDQKAILLLDCYPVHTGEEFRKYVQQEFPNVFLVYVPANCPCGCLVSSFPWLTLLLGTGIFQPADVGLQRIIKHWIRQAQLLSLVKNHAEQRGNGLTTQQVQFTTSLPVLHDASVSHIVSAWEFLNSPDGRDIVQKVCYYQSGVITC
jgi:hypothetical protein